MQSQQAQIGLKQLDKNQALVRSQDLMAIKLYGIYPFKYHFKLLICLAGLNQSQYYTGQIFLGDHLYKAMVMFIYRLLQECKKEKQEYSSHCLNLSSQAYLGTWAELWHSIKIPKKYQVQDRAVKQQEYALKEKQIQKQRQQSTISKNSDINDILKFFLFLGKQINKFISKWVIVVRKFMQLNGRAAASQAEGWGFDSPHGCFYNPYFQNIKMIDKQILINKKLFLNINQYTFSFEFIYLFFNLFFIFYIKTQNICQIQTLIKNNNPSNKVYQNIKIIIKNPLILMTSSPSRRQSSYRLNLTHQQNRISNRFQSISQRSPIINSPKLNQQSQVDNVKNQLNTELKTKLQIVLKHNSQLLNENATLSEMVNSLRMELELMRKQSETKTLETTVELNRVMEQLKNSQLLHEGELAKLLNQISNLHQENLTFQTQKNKQIKLLKQNHQRQLAVHIAQIKRSSDDNKDILDIQIKKLKQTIELRQFEIQSLKIQTKCEIDRLRFENQNLNTEIQHLRRLKQIEIKQLLNEQKQKTKNQLKQIQRTNQLEILKRQSNIKKLKKQIIHKNMEIQQTRKQGITQTEELYDQLTSAKNDKVLILEELQQIKQSSIEKLNREKQRLRKMAEIEKENMDSIINAQRALLKQQRQKIILLCIQKTQQIKRLYQIINEQKDTFENQKNILLKLINEFKQKLKDVQLQNKEENELLKIKMAQLHQGDIKALENYYQNETRNLIRQNRILTQAHQADRAKLHKALQDNDEIRKNFEIQISKQKAKLQDMKVKFAAANVQFKEQITSLGTKMQLTSQTLLRETQQKQKGAQFFEAQKKKFFRIIEQKDRQIIAIQQTMSKLKQINDEEISQLHSQINMLRDSLIAKQQEFKQFKARLQGQFQRKSLKLIQQSQRISPDDEIIQQNKKIRQKSDNLQKQNFKKTKQIQFLLRQNKSLQGQLGLRAGFIQTLQLQSSAAIQDQKSKIKILMNQSQVAMKDYYESKLSGKQKDIENLKKQLGEKDYDLRAVITKYNALQKKLKQLLQAQNKLTDFENKITQLGLDQNLVKNMAQLFKKYKN